MTFQCGTCDKFKREQEKAGLTKGKIGFHNCRRCSNEVQKVFFKKKKEIEKEIEKIFEKKLKKLKKKK